MVCCETMHSKLVVCFHKNTRFQKEQKEMHVECRSGVNGRPRHGGTNVLSQTWSDTLRAGRQVAVWRVKNK